MKQKKAYKYRFYPSAAQQRILAQTFGCCRFVYNWALRERTDAYYQHGERLYYEGTAQRLVLLKKQEDPRVLGNGDVFASHHLLGGYAMFQQTFPDEVLEKGLAMFLQIGSDAHTAMEWGDGGELTFYADAKALAKGRFERLWGECQCG